MPVKPRLERVIVVGASSGIGAALARQLALAGSHVAILGRRGVHLERVRDWAEDLVHPYVHDVRDWESVPDLFERIESDLGGVDALFYAAGAMSRISIDEYAFVEDRTMIQVNLLGAMAWMNLAAVRFQAARCGTIVGISSIAGERGRRGNPGYCASKAGLTAYLEALRNRCSRFGVNVVTIKPGFVDTDMTRGLPGLFWLTSADEAARRVIALTRRGSSASGYVPARWGIVATIVRGLPSFVFRRLNL